jgi:hypothetical protein
MRDWRRDIVELELAELALAMARRFKGTSTPPRVTRSLARGFQFIDGGDIEIGERWLRVAERRAVAKTSSPVRDDR